MTKVYVVFVKLVREEKPRVQAFTDKSQAIEHRDMYKEMDKDFLRRTKKHIASKIQMRTIDF